MMYPPKRQWPKLFLMSHMVQTDAKTFFPPGLFWSTAPPVLCDWIPVWLSLCKPCCTASLKPNLELARINATQATQDIANTKAVLEKKKVKLYIFFQPPWFLFWDRPISDWSLRPLSWKSRTFEVCVFWSILRRPNIRLLGFSTHNPLWRHWKGKKLLILEDNIKTVRNPRDTDGCGELVWEVSRMPFGPRQPGSSSEV